MGISWRPQAGDACASAAPHPPPARDTQELGSGSSGHRLLPHACALLSNQSLLKLQQAPNYFSS